VDQLYISVDPVSGWPTLAETAATFRGYVPVRFYSASRKALLKRSGSDTCHLHLLVYSFAYFTRRSQTRDKSQGMIASIQRDDIIH
jgi:hypothetical protein